MDQPICNSFDLQGIVWVQNTSQTWDCRGWFNAFTLNIWTSEKPLHMPKHACPTFICVRYIDSSINKWVTQMYNGAGEVRPCIVESEHTVRRFLTGRPPSNCSNWGHSGFIYSGSSTQIDIIHNNIEIISCIATSSPRPLQGHDATHASCQFTTQRTILVACLYEGS